MPTSNESTKVPVLVALETAPEDDEPFTEEDEYAAIKARAQVARGEAVSHDEVLRRLERSRQ